MFFTLTKTEIVIQVTFNLSSANAFNLDQSKILLFGKELSEFKLCLLRVQIMIRRQTEVAVLS